MISDYKIERVSESPYPDIEDGVFYLLESVDGNPWSVCFRCPCGCGQYIHLPVLKDSGVYWDLSIDEEGRPSLSPSILSLDGCKSNFFIKNGKSIIC